MFSPLLGELCEASWGCRLSCSVESQFCSLWSQVHPRLPNQICSSSKPWLDLVVGSCVLAIHSGSVSSVQSVLGPSRFHFWSSGHLIVWSCSLQRFQLWGYLQRLEVVLGLLLGCILTGSLEQTSPFLSGRWLPCHILAASSPSSAAWLECCAGPSWKWAPMASDHFWLWTSDHRRAACSVALPRLLPTSPSQCWSIWSQHLWGSLNWSQQGSLPEVDMLPILSLMHHTGWWSPSLDQSIWGWVLSEHISSSPQGSWCVGLSSWTPCSSWASVLAHRFLLIGLEWIFLESWNIPGVIGLLACWLVALPSWLPPTSLGQVWSLLWWAGFQSMELLPEESLPCLDSAWSQSLCIFGSLCWLPGQKPSWFQLQWACHQQSHGHQECH